MTNPWITAIVAVLVLGFVWGILYDTVHVTAYNLLIQSTAEAAGPELAAMLVTWNLLLWIWNAGPIILAASLALAAFSPSRNQYGANINNAVIECCVCLACWALLIVFWATLYWPLNHTIPSAFSSVTPVDYAPYGYLLTAYNTGFIVLMVGFGFVVLARSFNIPKPSEDNKRPPRWSFS